MGKHNMKILNKLPKGEKAEPKLASKITKKKAAVINVTAATKKVSMIKELATKNNDLVDLKESNQLRYAKFLVTEIDGQPPQPKQKPVEKQKKRKKTQSLSLPSGMCVISSI